MGHVAKPRFKRSVERWVALMPITLVIPSRAGKPKEDNQPRTRTLKVGETFKTGELRLHVLKCLFLRGRVGPAGHQWTENVLARRTASTDSKKSEPVAEEKPAEEPITEQPPESEQTPEPAQKAAPRPRGRPRKKVG